MKNHHLKCRFAAVLAAVCLFAACALPRAAAASWSEPYLQQLSQWGVMRGYSDGNFRPDNPITRAEFAALVNRAFGYDETGPIPFADVAPSAWYADDIAIAYHTGYMAGTSATTASPNDPLTREQAAVILARNLMLQPIPGEVTEFTDGQRIKNWSGGYIKAAVAQGLVGGYADGTFRPKKNITRGEVARLLVASIGTLLQTEGVYSPGAVYGNLTITASGVTLRDTVITGDLYITGGVGLGYINLENVQVLGKIIVSGSGESNQGDSSVILRNVEAPALVLDGLHNQFVTLRAEGDTRIDQTSVRTNSYLEDRTPDGYGLLQVALEGEKGTTLDLAGNVKEAVNKTADSVMALAQGTAKSLTVDEKAVNSTLRVDNGASAKTVNLDVGTAVTGSGDVASLNVNAPGSSAAVLPDTITVRPGLTATVNGQAMDAVAAQEASAEPRLLAGYPQVRDTAPTSCSALFSANKSGTVYWAVSAVADGSVDEEDLIAPPAYGGTALRSGSVKLSASGRETAGKVTGLTAGGSYYLSAVLVDARGWRSPVKVVSFSTPDNTSPAFAAGYPVLSKLTSTSAQATVMATKSCKLYYALLPKGSSAPSANDFKTASVSGNLGYGAREIVKNRVEVLSVNDVPLEELKSYDLYLWLSDADGAKSSAVKKLTFTTVDGTPPVFRTGLTVNAAAATSIGCFANLNEDATVYWAAVKTGTDYPVPPAGKTYDDFGGKDAYLKTPEAKIQVLSGMNALRSGKAAAKANTDVKLTVSGLAVQTAYDIYYVAVDKAGNYSAAVDLLTANTLDNLAPTAEQAFTRYSGNNKNAPLADTDVRIVFSEGVQRASTGGVLTALYQKVEDAAKKGQDATAAKADLAGALRATIKLFNATGSGPARQVAERTGAETDWVIDYRNAAVTAEEGRTVVTFPTRAAAGESALNLSSGSSYYFQLEDLADVSSAKNLMGVTKLPVFTTVSAEVNLSAINVTSAELPGSVTKELHMAFSLTPVSTSKVEDSIDYDMLLWCDSSVEFDLYRRTRAEGAAGGTWEKVNSATPSITSDGSYDYVGVSLTRDLLGRKTPFAHLNALQDGTVYEYGIVVTRLNGSGDQDTWNKRVNFRVSVVAGSSVLLGNLAGSVTPDNLQEALDSGVSDVGVPQPFRLQKFFSDSRAPEFTDGYPTFAPLDTSVELDVMLDRPGTVYYVVAPVGQITTKGPDLNGDTVSYTKENLELVPESGADGLRELSAPGYLNIVTPNYSNSLIKSGSKYMTSGVNTVTVRDLKPETDYFVYFILKSEGQIYSDSVMLYRFRTSPVSRPVITLDISNPAVNVRTDASAAVDYLLIVYNNQTMSSVLKEPFGNIADNTAEGYNPSYDTLTVLQAMSTDVVENHTSKGSVFDLYAPQDEKSKVADYIRNQTVTDAAITLKGSLNTRAGASQSVDCSRGMSGTTWYCFLAVGRGAGSGDAFRAIYPVHLQDTEAPKVAALSLTGSVTTDTNRFTGMLAVSFNEPIYIKETGFDPEGNPIQKIIPIRAFGSAQESTNAFKTAMSVVTQNSSGGAFTASSQNSKDYPAESILFVVTNVGDGASLTFPSMLCDATGQTRDARLTITIHIQDDKASVSITPSWDART